jgi:hypothetical protein
MSVAIIYNGPGTNNFCVEQTVNTYKAHLNDKEVQIQIHNQNSIGGAAAQKGVKRKWIIFPGGLADEIAKHALIATATLRNIWNTQENVDFIGHCAGSIYLGSGGSDLYYSQYIKGDFFSYTWPEGELMCAYKGRIAAPCLPWKAPIEDPSNCKAISVQHHLGSSANKIDFHSCVWLGPAFPQALNCKIVRTLVDPVNLEIPNESWPFNELHQGVDLPVALLDKNPVGNRVFLQGDHLEIDPLALDQEKFESMYAISQSLIQQAKSVFRTLPKEIQLQNFQETQRKLMTSNAARIEALRDGMSLLDMPLKPLAI